VSNSVEFCRIIGGGGEITWPAGKDWNTRICLKEYAG
jgi:hypothetical protein